MAHITEYLCPCCGGLGAIDPAASPVGNGLTLLEDEEPCDCCSGKGTMIGPVCFAHEGGEEFCDLAATDDSIN